MVSRGGPLLKKSIAQMEANHVANQVANQAAEKVAVQAVETARSRQC